MISDWSDLQTVLAISEAGSLSGAARALGVNQSTISRRLRSIEASLDRAVFARTEDGGLVPDAAGHQLIETARRIRELVGESNARLGGAVIPLRIASCEVLSRSHAAPLLAQWSAESGQPGDLSVYDNLFELPKDSFDVIVTPLESAPDDMIGRRIGRLHWGLFASEAYLAGHPFAAGSPSLAGHDVVHPSGSLAEVRAYRWLMERGGRVTFSSSSPLLQRDAAIAGAGVALLPETIVERDGSLVRLQPGGQLPITDIWMISRKDARARPSVASFLEWAHGSLERPLSTAGAAR